MKTRACLVAITVLLSSCASATPAQKGAVAGSAIGAGLGAVVGHQVGRKTAEGALIGAAVGGLGGALVGDAAASQFCPQCGRTFFRSDAPSGKCPFDGTDLRQKGGAPAQNTQQQQTQTSLPKFCPVCGRDYPQSATYCSVDGNALKVKQS